MQHSKSNLLLILLIFAVGCQSTRVFEVQTFSAPPETNLDDRHMIRIQANRVRQECLFLNAEAGNKWRHQYFMYLLTGKNDVLPVMFAINQEGSVCQKQLKRIQKILDRDKEVTICANSELTKISKKDERTDPIQFGHLGTHEIAYDTLFLDAVCDSKDCFIYKDVLGCSSTSRGSD